MTFSVRFRHSSPAGCPTCSLAGCTMAGKCKVAPPSQHTSPWTTAAPALWCCPGPGGRLAAVTERGEMHLGMKNMGLAIALKYRPLPKTQTFGRDTDPPLRLVMSWTPFTVRRITLHLYSKPHFPQSINTLVLKAWQKNGAPGPPALAP